MLHIISGAWTLITTNDETLKIYYILFISAFTSVDAWVRKNDRMFSDYVTHTTIMRKRKVL